MDVQTVMFGGLVTVVAGTVCMYIAHLVTE